MTGVSWRPGCPVHIDNLRLIRTTFWDFDGKRETGSIVVHEGESGEIVRVFRSLYRQKFKIRRMQLIDRYNASDHASMNADNTSAFNCRYVAGTRNWSQHAYGRAIDLNPIENPYVTPSGHVRPRRGSRTRTARATTRAWSTAATRPTAPLHRRTGSGAATGPARRTTSTSRATAAELSRKPRPAQVNS